MVSGHQRSTSVRSRDPARLRHEGGHGEEPRPAPAGVEVRHRRTGAVDVVEEAQMLPGGGEARLALQHRGQRVQRHHGGQQGDAAAAPGARVRSQSSAANTATSRAAPASVGSGSTETSPRPPMRSSASSSSPDAGTQYSSSAEASRTPRTTPGPDGRRTRSRRGAAERAGRPAVLVASPPVSLRPLRPPRPRPSPSAPGPRRRLPSRRTGRRPPARATDRARPPNPARAPPPAGPPAAAPPGGRGPRTRRRAPRGPRPVVCPDPGARRAGAPGGRRRRADRASRCPGRAPRRGGA